MAKGTSKLNTVIFGYALLPYNFYLIFHKFELFRYSTVYYDTYLA